MQVPLLDLKPQYQSFKAELLPLLEKICDSQAFILGPQVVQLEAAVAKYSHCAHGIGVSSGTDALLLALMGLELGPGDEVITSPYTFFATGGTIARAGARPVYLDIEPSTYNLSPVAVQRFVEESCAVADDGTLTNRATGGRVRALMPVHLYGQCADMKPLMALAKRHRLYVIEDAAQAIGAEYQGARAGSFGDVGCFSFFPSKNLGAFGDAGLCTAQDAVLAERLRVLRVHGGKPKYYHALIGGNFRIDELQAAVLNVKLAHLDGWTAGRQRNAARYRELFAQAGIAERVTLPYEMPGPGTRHIYNQFVIRAPDRDGLKAWLGAQGIGTEIYYPVPLHLQQCFAYLGGKAGDCPESERAARETLALPVYGELADAQLDYVVANIAEYCRTTAP